MYSGNANVFYSVSSFITIWLIRSYLMCAALPVLWKVPAGLSSLRPPPLCPPCPGRLWLHPQWSQTWGQPASPARRVSGSVYRVLMSQLFFDMQSNWKKKRTTNLRIHVVENAEHSSLFRNRRYVTKVISPLDFVVPESVRKLKCNL